MADVTAMGDGFHGGPFPSDDLMPAGADLQFLDSTYLRFGTLDGGDANMAWDGTNLTLKPAVDDTGAFVIGDGTTDMDLKVFLKDTLNYALFDVGNQKVNLVFSTAGGDTSRGLDIDAAVLAGSGYRQGAINCQVTRAAGQVGTWDGNPDCGVKVIARNSAAHTASEGAVRALDVQGRNSGTNINWVEAVSFNARTDVGTTAVELCPVRIRTESYGTITTAYGIDVNLSIEGAATTKTGIQIRNSDASSMTAVNQVFKVSHTSTNGFTYLFHLNGATGDTFTAGELDDNASSDVNCDGYITILVDATPYYIPCYDTKA